MSLVFSPLLIRPITMPHDHISMDEPYVVLPQSSSGGRYHSVTTCGVLHSRGSTAASSAVSSGAWGCGGGSGGGGGDDGGGGGG